MFRFSNSLLVILLLAAVGSSVGLLLADPERYTYISQIQTCVYPEGTENILFWVVLFGYGMVLFCQGMFTITKYLV